MKITTKKELLTVLILVNLLVFGTIGAILYYYDGPRIMYPVVTGAAAMIVIQYKRRKKQLPEAE